MSFAFVPHVFLFLSVVSNLRWSSTVSWELPRALSTTSWMRYVAHAFRVWSFSLLQHFSDLLHCRHLSDEITLTVEVYPDMDYDAVNICKVHSLYRKRKKSMLFLLLIYLCLLLDGLKKKCYMNIIIGYLCLMLIKIRNFTLSFSWFWHWMKLFTGSQWNWPLPPCVWRLLLCHRCGLCGCPGPARMSLVLVKSLCTVLR